jgi:alginate O-acetyltransferase complex protein AlgI
MSFTSLEFLCFFLAVLAIRGCLPNTGARVWLLLAASYAFYLTWSIPGGFLLILISVADFCIARALVATESQRDRKRLLNLSLLINLGTLGFFKYSNFFLENVWFVLGGIGIHGARPHYDITLPAGISYFTFASMAYVIDTYYERMSPTPRLRDYSLFVSFFPKVLAGPIVRAGELLPQFEQRLRADAGKIEVGLSRFLVGAVKKLVISDQIAGDVNTIFGAPGQYDGLTLLVGALGYAIQIYCDFSGYTDMAIGCAQILGFEFPENFRMPYSSRSITEFWRRWHMTLSFWFRDYVFLPMEIARRNVRSATLRTCSNLMVTMLLCGLWHGASWNFVVWGGIHGSSLAIHKAWTTWNPLASLRNHSLFRLPWAVFSHGITLAMVVLAWVFFRTQSLSDAYSYLSRMLQWHHGIRLISPYVLLALAAVIFTHLFIHKDRNWAQEIPARSIPVRITAYAALVFLLSFFGTTDTVPFIYVQF